MRNLKILGLACIAAFAICGVMASAASATPFHFTTNSVTNTTITGDDDFQTDVLTTNAGKVSCLKVTYHGAVVGKSSPFIKVVPTYSECHIIVIFTFKATVNMSGCSYNFTAGTFEGSKYEGSMDIECPGAEGSFVVEVPGCTITVAEQNNLKTATYTPDATNTDLTIDLNLTGITYEEHEGFPNMCKTNTVKQHNGTYVGKSTMTGEQGPNPINIGVKTT